MRKEAIKRENGVPVNSEFYVAEQKDGKIKAIDFGFHGRDLEKIYFRGEENMQRELGRFGGELKPPAVNVDVMRNRSPSLD